MSEIKHQNLDLSGAVLTIEMPSGRVATILCDEATLSSATLVQEPEHRYISGLDGQPRDENELGEGRCGIFETIPDLAIGMKVSIDAPAVYQIVFDTSKEK